MASDPKGVDVADVYQSERRVGVLERRDNDTAFVYDPSVGAGEPGIAFHLPTETRIFVHGGGAVPPFFAGLLPEGARLTALAASVKTSLDDMFTLLVAVGGDCVGDVSIVPRGMPPIAPHALAEGDPSTLDFERLFERSLGRDPEGVDKVALAGFQEKVSAEMVSFPVGTSSAILKLNPPRLPRLVENEAFFLRMVAALGVRAAEARLVEDRRGRSGLLVRRFDRFPLGRAGRLAKTHQEDACQFTNVFPAAKYRLTSRDVAEGLIAHASSPPLAIRELVRQTATNYLIANGDFHAKNLSLYRAPQTGSVEVTPAYDVLSTLPYGDDRMAMKLDGRDKNLKRRNLVEFAVRHGAGGKAIHTLLDRICDASPPWIDRLGEIGFDAKITAHLRREILLRRERLGRSE